MRAIAFFILSLSLAWCLPAHAFDADCQGPTARMLYNPLTLKIDEIVCVDRDEDLAPHFAHGVQKVLDFPKADFDRMLINDGNQQGLPDLYKFEAYLRAHVPVS